MERSKAWKKSNTSLYFEEPEATHVPCSSAKVLLFIFGIIRFCVSGRIGSTGSGDGEGEGLGCAVSGVLLSGNFLLKMFVILRFKFSIARVKFAERSAQPCTSVALMSAKP